MTASRRNRVPGLRSLSPNQSGNDGLGLGGRPVRTSPKPGDFPAFRINNYADWKTKNAHLARQGLTRVPVLGKCGDANAFEEPPNRRGLVTAGRYSDNLKHLTAEFLLKGVKRWHFLAARRTPGGPEIQQQVLSPEGVKRQLLPGFVQKRSIGNCLWFGVEEQLAHLPLAQGLKSGGVRQAGVCAKKQRGVENGSAYPVHRSASRGEKMSKDSPNAMWGGRFAEGPDAIMEAINASIGFDQRLAGHDIRGSRAHAAMLAAQGIISDSDAQAIREGLLTVLSEIESGEFDFSTALEDIHMNVEARLKEIVGEPAGRLHTARSRNDQVATDFRMWVRDQLDALDGALAGLSRALLAQAEAGADWVMPGFTHLQVAQPVTWGHHLLAYVEMFARDRSRFSDARARMNECPLGAAALAGTSFPIDREMTSEALGFDRPCANSIDAVSDRDFAMEFLSAASICAVHLSRLAEELVIWSTAQFRFVEMSDRFSTGSSIMPQKRNPDAAELVRAKSGRVLGATVSLFTVMKGLPLTYSKDMQEDKEQVFDAADSLMLAIAAMEGIVRDMCANVAELEAAAAAGFSTATDLADWLVRERGMPFREAHRVTGSLVALAESKRCGLPALSMEDMASVYTDMDEGVFDVLEPKRSVASRTSLGGTAPVRVREEIARWKEVLG